MSKRVSDTLGMIDVGRSKAYIRKFALRPNEFGQLVDKGTVLIVLYPALPIGASC